jgi:hypothetical protein
MLHIDDLIQPRAEQIARTARGKKESQAPASANLARRAPRHHRTLLPNTTAAVPVMSKIDMQSEVALMNLPK